MEGNNGCPLNGEQPQKINACSNPGLGSSDPPQVILGSASRGHRGEPLRIKRNGLETKTKNQRIQATTGVPNGNPVELEP